MAAGPFSLMTDSPRAYRRVKGPGGYRRGLSPISTACPSKVQFFFVDNALSVKASIPRPMTLGDPGDSDSHGGQQYAPLMEIDI